MSAELRRHRPRGRPAGRALRRGPRRRRLAGGDRRARAARRANAPTGPASRRRRCCVRGRRSQAAREAPGAREAVTGDLDAASVFAWRDFMVSDYDDAGKAAWPAEQGIDVLRGDGRLAGPARVEVDGTAYAAEHIVIATGSDPVIPPIPGLRELTASVDEPRGHRADGGAAAAARARRRPGRRRDGPGGEPAGRGRRARGGRRIRC